MIGIFFRLLFYLGNRVLPKLYDRLWPINQINIQPILLVIILCLIFSTLFFQRLQWFRWAMKRQYTVFNDSREVGRIISDVYIAGLWSPMICLENRHRALCVAEGWFNDRDTFRRYPLTLLFLWGRNHDEERRFLNRAYPQIMAKTKEMKVLYVKGHPARLLKLEQ